MGSYCYLVCHNHREYVPSASVSIGGIRPICDAVFALYPFIAYHRDCTLNVTYDGDGIDVSEEDGYMRWEKENHEQLSNRDLNENK